MISRTSTTLLDGLADPNNESVWRRFYARYVPMLLSYAKRVGLSDSDAQDAVAETLVTFVQAYRAGRYDRERARLKSWLGGIMTHKVQRLRERRRETPSAESDALRAVATAAALRNEVATASSLDEAFDREWRLERLGEALAIVRQEVDPTTYQAFDLYTLKDWPVAKVASFLSVTPNVVYISRTRVVKRLRQIVESLASAEES